MMVRTDKSDALVTKEIMEDSIIKTLEKCMEFQEKSHDEERKKHSKEKRILLDRIWFLEKWNQLDVSKSNLGKNNPVTKKEKQIFLSKFKGFIGFDREYIDEDVFLKSISIVDGEIFHPKHTEFYRYENKGGWYWYEKQKRDDGTRSKMSGSNKSEMTVDEDLFIDLRDFSCGASQTLFELKLTKVRDLIKVTSGDLMRENNFGLDELKEITDFLDKFGLRLKDD